MKPIKSNLEVILKTLFIVSLPFLSLFLCTRFSYAAITQNTICSFIIAIIIVKFFLKRKFETINKFLLIVSTIFALYMCKIQLNYCQINGFFMMAILGKLGINFQFIKSIIILSLLALPSLTMLIYIFFGYLYSFGKNLFISLDNTEKKYLLTVIIFGLFLTTILFYCTNVFYKPVTRDLQFDIIYTTDSAYLINEDVYSNINMSQNDLRQPLFGLLTLPFAIIAKMASELLYFIPNTYIVLINVIQIFLLALSLILIAKMININDKKEKFLFFLFGFSTYPFIIFSFAMEQYIFSLFYLIITIYCGLFNNSKVNYYYIGAVGTMLTSGIVFPLISKFSSFKSWINNILKCLLAFIATVVIAGQLPLFIDYKIQFKLFMGFSGINIPLVSKLKQYLYFVKSLIFAPNAHIVYESDTYRYWLKPVSHFDIIGLAIIILCLLGFILNRKNKFALISFLWILFSFIILCLFGWGTRENGLILYSLYFSWAFLSLLYLLIKTIINNTKYRKILMILITFFMLTININEFINVFKFGLKYYGG